MYIVQNYLVDLRDKSGFFGFEKFVDGFFHKNRHHDRGFLCLWFFYIVIFVFCEIISFEKIVDDFVYKNLHHLKKDS